MRALHLAVAAGVAAVYVVLGATPAAAHAALLEASPRNAAIVADTPDAVTLRFSEPVSANLGAVKVIDPAGNRVDTGEVTTRAGGAEIIAPLRHGHATGTHIVVWRVVSQDSHPVSGTSTFSVGAPSASAGTESESSALAEHLLTVARLLVFLGIIVLLGGAGFVTGLWPSGMDVRRVRRALWASWTVAMLGAAAALFLQGPYAAGMSVSHVLDRELLAAVLPTRYGVAAAARIGLLALAAMILVQLGRRPLNLGERIAGLCLAAGIFTATAVSGHAAAGSLAGPAIAADVVHLAAAAAWVGGLCVLVLGTLRSAESADIAIVLPRWSRWAAVAVSALVATGLFASWREVRELGALTSTSYGQLLLLKTGLVLGMLALGARGRVWIRRRYGPTARSPAPLEPDVRRLRRAVYLEAGIALVVIAVTAVLVKTTPARVAYAPMFTATATVRGELRVQVDVEPARSGINQLHVYYTGAGGIAVNVEEVQARLVRAGTTDVIPIAVPLESLGHYEDLNVPISEGGRWQLTLLTRTSDIDVVPTVFDLHIR